MTKPMINIDTIHKSYLMGKEAIPALRGVSLEIEQGDFVCLMGPSGSGKTTTAMAAIRLTEAAGGQVLFEGEDLLTLSDEAMRQRRRDIQLIFQDPYSSLNPRARVADVYG